MKKIYPISVLLLVVVLIGLFVAGYYARQQPVVESHPSHLVLVVDYNNDKVMNSAELLSSQDAILAVRTSPESKLPEKQQVFNGLTALHDIDWNKDGRIDEKDPVFSYLELLFFDKNGKIYKRLSLEQAKVKAIIIERAQTPNKNSNTAGPKVIPAGYLLMQDGTKRNLKFMHASVEQP